TDHAAHDSHRMRVTPEAAEQEMDLFVQHRVVGNRALEIRTLLRVRQFAVQQQIAGLEERRLLRQISDVVAAIQQFALIAIDIGDLAFGAGRRREAWVVSEVAGLAVKLSDVDHRGADCAVKNGKGNSLASIRVGERNRRAAGGHKELPPDWNQKRSDCGAKNYRAGESWEERPAPGQKWFDDAKSDRLLPCRMNTGIVSHHR